MKHITRFFTGLFFSITMILTITILIGAVGALWQTSAWYVLFVPVICGVVYIVGYTLED